MEYTYFSRMIARFLGLDLGTARLALHMSLVWSDDDE